VTPQISIIYLLLRSRNFIFGGSVVTSTIPASLDRFLPAAPLERPASGVRAPFIDEGDDLAPLAVEAIPGPALSPFSADKRVEARV
jgi:hypothetical protein